MPGFLKLILCRSSACVFVCVCLCVCPPARLLITSGVMYSSMIWTPYDWLNKFYSRYMAVVVVIINGVALALICITDTNPLRVS